MGQRVETGPGDPGPYVWGVVMARIQVTFNAIVPRVPNFLLNASGEKIPISAVTDEALKAIGEEWTRNLIERAHQQAKGTK